MTNMVEQCFLFLLAILLAFFKKYWLKTLSFFTINFKIQFVEVPLIFFYQAFVNNMNYKYLVLLHALSVFYSYCDENFLILMQFNLSIIGHVEGGDKFWTLFRKSF